VGEGAGRRRDLLEFLDRLEPDEFFFIPMLKRQAGRAGGEAEEGPRRRAFEDLFPGRGAQLRALAFVLIIGRRGGEVSDMWQGRIDSRAIWDW